MKRFLALLFIALCGSAFAQTGITVMADTNRAVRTNFTIGNAQVTGLADLLSSKLTTNGNGAGLTNLTGSRVVGTVATASNITGILAISNGGTGSSSASNARTALGLGTAATNAATNFQPASTNLTALASGNGSSLTNIAPVTDASTLTNFPAELLRTNGDGSGLTSISVDLTTVLPAYSNNASKVLAVLSNETGVEWTAISNTVTDGSTITNIPVENLAGVLGVANGGTGGSNAVAARVNLLPGYTNNASKVLALNTNATDVEWITIANGGGGGTSGVTSVNVSGGLTGLTTSGGPITNSGTITLGGTLAIAAGGTGQTNTAAAIEALLPAYTNNEGKILGLDTNLALVWMTNAVGGSGTVTSIDASGGSTGMNFTGGPVTTNGTLTLGGTLAVSAGGTGAGDVTNARINLLPAYTNNAGKALIISTNGSDIEWASVATAPVSVANGGTGATNIATALANLGVTTASDGVNIGLSASTISGVAVGKSSRAVSTNGADGAYGVAIGNNAYASSNGVTIGYNAGSMSGVAVGNGAQTGAKSIAIGRNSGAEPGIAVGDGAVAYAAGAISIGDSASTYGENNIAIGTSAESDAINAAQIGSGTNTNSNTIQFFSAGNVTTNSWAALANSTTFGHHIMTAPTNGTNGQVLTVNSNASGVIWTTVSGVQADMTNVVNTLGVANGGTGATNASSARVNLLPSYTGNQNLVLTLNTNATDVYWSAAGSGIIDLSTTNATGILPVAKGGTGSSNVTTALTNLGIFTANSGLFISTITNSTTPNFAVVIGVGATNGANGTGNTVIGYNATGRDNGSSSGGVAIGRTANVTNGGTALGVGANANSGMALGDSSVATNGVQISVGTNSTANTIQFRSAGLVDTNEWNYLANISTKGGSRMTNTNGVSVTNTIIGYNGTNYSTNTITVIDGIITSWTQ